MSVLLPVFVLLAAALAWGVSSVTHRTEDQGAAAATGDFLFKFALFAAPLVAVALLLRA